jgi:serine/threonine-protein kinase ULK4
MEKSLDSYNLTESLISFISDNNLELNQKAIATLGEYLFFVATQVEAELDQVKLGQKPNWVISQESLTALLFALNHIDERVKFYALKTIENICSLTTIAKQYFASNDDFINKIIEIINSDCENQEIRTSAFNTVS